jgi:hypothetical protein
VFATLPLDRDPNNYEVYMAKKNGMPKDEYGAFLPEQEVGKTGTLVFSVIHVIAGPVGLLISPGVVVSKRKNTGSPTLKKDA